MKLGRLSPLHCVAPAAWLAFSPSASAAGRMIHLPEVTGAARYEGTLTTGGKSFRVRTESPWILCPDECDVDLRVFDAKGVLLGKARTDPETDAVTLAPSAAPSEPPQPAAKAPAEPPPAAPSTTSGDAPGEPGSDVAAAEPPPPPPPAPKHESEPTHSSPPPPPPPHGTPSLVTVSLGLGKEWLTAKGGVSDYQGSAGIGGTILSGWFRPTSGAVGGELEISAHNYSTTTQEVDVGTGKSRTHDSKFLRLGARATGFYDFLEGATGGPTLGLGAGFAYLKAPALVITDTSSGTADLAEQRALGPVVTLVASTSAEASHQFAALVDYMPLSFAKAWGATHAGATLSWRFAFVPALATVVDMHVASDHLKAKVGCPAVSSCTDETTAASRIVQARVGLGYRF